MSDTKEMIEVEQEEIPFDSQGEDSSLDESMGSFEDACEEHDACRVVDIRPDLYDEQSTDPMRDI